MLLYDAFSRERVVGPVREVLDQSRAPVVIFTWHVGPDLVDEAVGLGAAGVVSKASSARGAGRGPRARRGGEGARCRRGRIPTTSPAGGDWPGRAEGLTARQAEVLALIAQGLSNDEVAERAYITINSLKSHVRGDLPQDRRRAAAARQ